VDALVAVDLVRLRSTAVDSSIAGPCDLMVQYIGLDVSGEQKFGYISAAIPFETRVTNHA